MTSDDQRDLIEVRVDKVAQLFHTLDPFPFRERDLDQDVEDYIVGWARELPRSDAISIIVYLPEIELKVGGVQDVGEAFRRYFASRSVAIQHDLNELFRIGRKSLAIGIAILVGCFASAHLVAGYLPDPSLKNIVGESLLILGWVANWRPLEIFLYDWWPVAQRQRLYRRLAEAPVELRSYSSRLAQG
ncbi:MAG: hypothetical protein WBF99_07735 [Xanthobacteraceae bacterium]